MQKFEKTEKKIIFIKCREVLCSNLQQKFGNFFTQECKSSKHGYRQCCTGISVSLHFTSVAPQW
jgi:hypothetical protein